MKFNVEELKQFRKELDQTLKALANKYEIDITLGKIQVIDDMFSLRLNAEHAIKKPISKEATKKVLKTEKPKKDISDLNDEDLNNLDVDKIDFDSLADTTKKIKKAVKDITKTEPVKQSVKNEKEKKDIKQDLPKKAKEKDLTSISDGDLNDLDLDSLDLDSLDDDIKNEPVQKTLDKKETKKNIDEITDEELETLDLDDIDSIIDETPKNDIPLKKDEEHKLKIDNKKDDVSTQKKKIEDLTDEELETLDLDEIDFGDEEEKTNKSRKNNDVDDDSRYEQELERYLAPKVKKQDKTPKNVFEERELYSNDSEFSDDEIDEYIKSKNLLNYSFQAKLIQSEPRVQDLYTDIKNLLLSNEGVKSKVTWDFDDYIYNKKSIAKLEIDGDNLNVYLALDPLDYEGSYDVSSETNSKYQGTKLKVVLNNINDEDQMYDLIGDLAETFDIMPGEDRYDDYHFQYETDEELIERGLIKEN